MANCAWWALAGILTPFLDAGQAEWTIAVPGTLWSRATGDRVAAEVRRAVADCSVVLWAAERVEAA
jgi:hypothetical protein